MPSHLGFPNSLIHLEKSHIYLYLFVPASRESRRDFLRKYAGGTLLDTSSLRNPAFRGTYDKISVFAQQKRKWRTEHSLQPFRAPAQVSAMDGHLRLSSGAS